ncbi:unnamed protein product [Ilex paraguariensis]|uniref:CRAL/TRIO N-terminal domain-containing protein n=1 Tax=Ilex paraguariensis TaxID=185542 RepID=A0ABC8UXG6_9AQUA
MRKSRKKLSLMRAFVEKQDPSSKEVDDLMIRRFLRARDLDIEKASTMFLKYLKWKRTFIPNESISTSEIPNDLAQNKMFMQGMDKKGRPITVAFGGRHFHNKGGLDEFQRMFLKPFLNFFDVFYSQDNVVHSVDVEFEPDN